LFWFEDANKLKFHKAGLDLFEFRKVQLPTVNDVISKSLELTVSDGLDMFL
jgi:hypothetical protein